MNSEKLRRLAGTEYTRMALIFLGVIVLLAIVIWVPKLSFIQPSGLTDAKDRAQAESDLRGHLLQALAGLVLAVGAFYTGRTFALNREGQITERFTRAVEQLGNDEKLDVRLGGIYALERIARDSQTHYEPVVEVLTAFLREHADWRSPTAAVPEYVSEDTPGAEYDVTFGTWVLGGTGNLKLPEDLQAAATVLGRRDRKHERRGSYYRLNLSRVDLAGVQLVDADFAESELSEADLTWANLFGADLSGANLSGANLTAANLTEADLTDAFLTGADLSSVRRGLTQEQIDSASTWDATLPEYLLQEGTSQGPGGEPNAYDASHNPGPRGD
jgi:Pentapeptide repeats (8 copies)